MLHLNSEKLNTVCPYCAYMKWPKIYIIPTLFDCTPDGYTLNGYCEWKIEYFYYRDVAEDVVSMEDDAPVTSPDANNNI